MAVDTSEGYANALCVLRGLVSCVPVVAGEVAGFAVAACQNGVRLEG